MWTEWTQWTKWTECSGAPFNNHTVRALAAGFRLCVSANVAGQCRSCADTPPSDQRNIYQGAGLLNYAAQQRYLSQSRVWGMLAAVALLGIAAAGIVTGQSFNQTSARVAQPPWALTIISALIVVALAFSIFYTPDYLQ